MKHNEVAYEWSCQRKATGNRMYCDEKTIFSYGSHFPIAHFLDFNTVLLNTDSYSSSTSKHQSYVRRNIPSRCVVYECDTKTIRDAIINPDKPIIIEREIPISSYNQLLRLTKEYFKSKGLKRFPLKELDNFFNQKILTRLI